MTKQDFETYLQQERKRSAIWMFVFGAFGLLIGYNDGYIQGQKSVVKKSDPTKKEIEAATLPQYFQNIDTIKSKQR